MALLFKIGDPSNCANYRPISLLCIGYKIVAAILLQRLKKGGAEKNIWETQFGFKSNSGTFDALFLLRRVLDHLWAEKDASAVFVALDWATAFDRISPAGLIDACGGSVCRGHFISYPKYMRKSRMWCTRHGTPIKTSLSVS